MNFYVRERNSVSVKLPISCGGLRDMEEYFVLPEATAGSEPSWFGFPIAVPAGARRPQELVGALLLSGVGRIYFYNRPSSNCGRKLDDCMNAFRHSS